ncbi:MAG: PAS domain-containing protein, partial [Lachnospiraceae bacterium]|nr:PAS domain-containing protein [Lachnospiraceae bacterium]
MNKKRKIKHSGKLQSYMQWPVILAVFLLAMNIIVYMTSAKAGLIVSVFLAVYIVLLLVLMLGYRPYIMKEMIAFASQYAQIQKQMLKHFSIPYAVLDSDGRIMWMNDAFCDVTGKEANYRKNIACLIPELDSNVLPDKKDETSIDVFYNGSDYRAQMHKLYMDNINDEIEIVEIPQENNYLIALYLFDTTELNYYIRQNQQEQMVAGLIYLDNYEEALESVEEVRRSLLVALIDRKISKYITNLDGITKKIEKDKYFVILKYKSLEELESNRFSLLEEVKTVNIGNDMSVTLSIGIGVNGTSYNQNYDFSRVAIELALGRGGDQAVVKDN